MKKENTEQEIIETAEVVHTPEEADSRIYELGYHIVPTVKDEDVEKVVGDIRGVIEKHKGNFIAEGAPQSIKLAYEMAVMSSHGKRTMFDRAHFGWIKFEVVPEAAVELKKMLAIDKRILRSIIFLTVREDTRAAARPVLRDVRRTDSIDTTRKVVEEKSDVPVSEEAIDKAIADIVIE